MDQHEIEINELWEKFSKNKLIRGLKEGKDISEIIPKEKIAEAFKEAPCCLGCSDGRIHEPRLGRAGMGILAGVEATVDSLKAMVDSGELTGEGLKITSHSGCGAAKIVCNKLIEEGKLPAGTEPDSLGINFAKEVVKGLWEKGIKAGYDHIESIAMDKLHDERAIYLDGTGKINIEDVKDENGERIFPRGFIFTDLKLNKEVTIAELKALCGIARGDHGFGERFNKENPFYILVSAKNGGQYEELKKIADEVADGADEAVRVEKMTIQ